MDNLMATHHRRPSIHTIVATVRAMNSGVDLTLDRHGISISGYFDGFVGIEGGSMTWEEFDALRAVVVSRPKRDS